MIHFPGLKHLFSALSIFSLFLLSNNIKAQTPVCKWTEVSSKQFLTVQGVKSYGRSVLETGMTTIGVVIPVSWLITLIKSAPSQFEIHHRGYSTMRISTSTELYSWQKDGLQEYLLIPSTMDIRSIVYH